MDFVLERESSAPTKIPRLQCSHQDIFFFLTADFFSFPGAPQTKEFIRELKMGQVPRELEDEVEKQFGTNVDKVLYVYK